MICYVSSCILSSSQPFWRHKSWNQNEEQEDCKHACQNIRNSKKSRFDSFGDFLFKKIEHFCGKQKWNGNFSNQP